MSHACYELYCLPLCRIYKHHPEELWKGEEEAFSPTETLLNHSDQCLSIREKLEIELDFSILSSLVFLLLSHK